MNRKLKNRELNRVSIEHYREREKLPIVVLLEDVRSAHNVGSTFRSSDAFAIESLYLCGITATPPSAEIRKAALGAEESVEWHYFKESREAIAQLIERGYKIVAVEQTVNSTMLDHFTPKGGERYAFIFGNEIKGVAQTTVDLSHSVIEIPQFGTKHSLNLSISVGILLWDIGSKMRGMEQFKNFGER